MPKQKIYTCTVSEQPHNGIFLVRKSESSPENFLLSVSVNDGVRDFMILKDDKSKYFVWVMSLATCTQTACNLQENIAIEENIPKMSVGEFWDFLSAKSDSDGLVLLEAIKLTEWTSPNCLSGS